MKQVVVDSLRNASFLHLACHGQQHPTNPLASGFLLRGGRLTVLELMQLKLTQPFLAFLSACETAKGDRSQPDQVVHLAATMLFIGFKSVVGTMWYAPQSTRSFRKQSDWIFMVHPLGRCGTRMAHLFPKPYMMHYTNARIWILILFHMPLMLLCSAYERVGNLQSDGQPTYILVYKDKWLRTEVGFAYAMTPVPMYIICLCVLRIIIFATAIT